MFSVWDRNLYTEAVWPDVHDMRHGTVPGMRKLPYYAAMTDEEYEIKRKGKAPITNPIEGFDPKSPLWDGKTPVFRALDVSYDQVSSRPVEREIARVFRALVSYDRVHAVSVRLGPFWGRLYICHTTICLFVTVTRRIRVFVR